MASFAETPPPIDAKGEAVAGAAYPVQKANTAPSSANQERASPNTASKQAQEGSAAKEPSHLTAQVVSIEYPRGEMVLHLDNGQVWEQVQEASAELSLRAGDTVTIDKGVLGTYWLGGRSGVVKVRQRQ